MQAGNFFEKNSFFRTTWFSWFTGMAMLVLVGVVVAHFSEERNFALLLEKARPGWLGLGVFLQACTYLAEARLWQTVLKRRGVAYPLRSYISLSLAKLFMDQALPSGGLSGSLLIVGGLKRKGISHETAISALVISMASYYAAYLAALFLSLAILWRWGNLTQVILIPAGLFMLFSASALVFFLTMKRPEGGGTATFWKHIPFIKNLAKIFDSARPEMTRDPSLLAQGSLLQLCIFILDGATVWTMLKAVGFNPSPFAVFPSYMVSSLARTMGFMPGGLGTFEAVSVATLKIMGVPVAPALAGTLLFRGLSFWLPMIPGLIFTRHLSNAKPSPTQEKVSNDPVQFPSPH